jgi:tetratricopeptide (TPR) repeat protein
MDEIEKKYEFIFLKDVDEKKIINLFNHDVIEECNDDKYWNYVGLYYEKKLKDYDLMKKYYLMAIDKGNSDAMNNLGHYYYYTEKNHDLMKKYYLMAIDKGNSYTMYNLGYYYKEIKIDYHLMKKYYIMAVEKGSVDAMYHLGYYYHKIEKNYDLMKKYYLMAIDKDSVEAMYHLGDYYENIEKNYDLMKKYYLMTIECDEIFTNMFNNYYESMNEFDLTYNDIELIIKYNICVNVNLNMKIIIESDFICNNYVYLQKYNNNRKYIGMINLVYCN